MKVNLRVLPLLKWKLSVTPSESASIRNSSTSDAGTLRAEVSSAIVDSASSAHSHAAAAAGFMFIASFTVAHLSASEIRREFSAFIPTLRMRKLHCCG